MTLDWPLYLFFIGKSFDFIIGPALYFYTKSLIYENFHFKKRDLLHLIPFVSYVILIIMKYYIYPPDIMREIAQGYPLSGSLRKIVYISIIFHFTIYSMFSLSLIKQYHAELKNSFSSLKKINLSWLSYIIVGFIFIYGVAFVRFTLRSLTDIDISHWGKVFLTLLFMYANGLIYKGLKHPEIFRGVDYYQKKDKSYISQSSYKNYLDKITSHMAQKKSYLIPAITLSDLANEIKISPRTLSYIINRSYNLNFFDFINQYRVEESKRMLSDPAYNHQTILGVCYEAGFNSKSVFNTSFKKFAGMTPSEFRRQGHTL
jgi:AraC-like DNA-binding protein